MNINRDEGHLIEWNHFVDLPQNCYIQYDCRQKLDSALVYGTGSW